MNITINIKGGVKMKADNLHYEMLLELKRHNREMKRLIRMINKVEKVDIPEREDIDFQFDEEYEQSLEYYFQRDRFYGAED